MRKFLAASALAKFVRGRPAEEWRWSSDFLR
jgi:hypothetical protein